MFGTGKSVETESGLVVAWGWGWGTGEADGCRVAFGGEEHVTKLGRGDGCITECTEPRGVLTFRGVAGRSPQAAPGSWGQRREGARCFSGGTGPLWRGGESPWGAPALPRPCASWGKDPFLSVAQGPGRLPRECGGRPPSCPSGWASPLPVHPPRCGCQRGR